MTTYVDSSVILRRLLGQPDSLAEWDTIDQAVTSVITRVECLRALDRRRAAGRLTADGVSVTREAVLRYLGGFTVVELDAAILERICDPFATPLATLDAVHLATASLWKQSQLDEIRVATHDRQLARCARAMGIPVIGVA